MTLTETQQKVVDAFDSALLVTAPAGAGKTEVMARRAAAAAKNGKKSLLCLTFTNRAANSMKKRVADLVGQDASVTVCTLHAFCNQLIRADAKTLGMPFGYTIMDEEDAKSIISALLSTPNKILSDHDLKSAATCLDDYRLAKAKDTDKLEKIAERFKSRFSADITVILTLYLRELSRNNALDFLSLILITDAFLQEDTHLARWQAAYDFIQVDEMQDTGLIEYDMLAKLAAQHKNLSLFGDTDQTIYEWRDSRPFEIIEQFRETFKPKEFTLSQNFRSTQLITECAEGFMASYFEQPGKQIIAVGEPGETVKLCFLNSVASEKQQIIRILKKQAEMSIPFGQMAVLTRTNSDARIYSEALVSADIPSYVIDEYNFFRREEIKDALAALKLLVNINDTESAKRLLLKYARNIGTSTLSDILESELPVSMADFLANANTSDEDLLAPIIQPYLDNQLVVFDVESTGLNTETDEIIELAAVRFGQDGVLDEFHHYIRPQKPVGASQAVHGYSDDFLAEQGEVAKSVLTSFIDFCGSCVLAGHNVAYDIAILSAELARWSIPHPDYNLYFDTLNAAMRIAPDAANYKLGSLCMYFGIEEEPTHHAMDDVWATCELADICMEQLMGTIKERTAFYALYKDKFRPFAEFLKTAKAKSQTERPHQLLQSVIVTLKMKQHYQQTPNKLTNLDDLVLIFAQLDDSALRPEHALKQILELTALSGTLERQIEGENRVAVLTVHQAKGLQFNTVIIAGAVEGAFPSSLNIRYDKLDEEARLFYVAMTRASKHLFITLGHVNERGEQNQSSRFLRHLPKPCTQVFAQSQKETS